MIDDRELASAIAAVLALLFIKQHRIEEAVEWARRAIGSGGTPELVAPVRSILTVAPALRGRTAAGLATVDLAGPADPPRSPGEVDSLLGRGIARLWTDDLAGACADLATVAEASRRSPISRFLGLGWLAEAEYRRGFWDASAAHAAQAISLAPDDDHLWSGSFVHAIATRVLAAQGDSETTSRHVRAAQEVADALGDAASIAYAAIAAAYAAFCGADYCGVLEAIDVLRTQPAPQVVWEPGVLPHRELQTAALLGLGRLAEAEMALADTEAEAHSHRRRSALARASRLRGMLEAARGNVVLARASFETALELLKDLEMPFELALARHAYGCFLRRARERPAAVAQLKEASAGYLSLRAVPFLNRCEQELAACGLKLSRGADPHRLDLTPQELAVARLVLAGHSNREVATKLVVSVKTVEYHLSHVYDKLGVTSRFELRERANRRQAAPGLGVEESRLGIIPRADRAASA